MEENEVIGPKSPKQEMILNTIADFAIVGGAMGSGKSFMALLYPLRYADDPSFRGIIFRKTTGELTAQGGLWETACELYLKIFGDALRIRKKDLKITFPSGASVKFSHMEHDNNRFQHMGAQYTFILWDEATHFSKTVIEYLGTRLRSAKAKHRFQVICTCNPDPDWFGLQWITPYLKEDGTPNQEMDGVLRYFVVDGGKYIWADTREELEERYGSGAESGIKSFTFISATCYDNPPLLDNNPQYISELKAKPWVDVQRYLYGNWFVRQSASGFFKREWLNELNYLPIDDPVVKRVRAYDIAGSLKSDLCPDPDYTVGVLMCKTKSGRYIIEDVIRYRARYGEVINKIVETAYKDGRDTDILLPVEPGQAGKLAAGVMVQEVVANGFYAKTQQTTKSKIERFRPFASAAENKLIDIIKHCAYDLENKVMGDNAILYDELERFDGGRKYHDDIADACGDGLSYLMRSFSIPAFLPPDMSTTNPFAIR